MLKRDEEAADELLIATRALGQLGSQRVLMLPVVIGQARAGLGQLVEQSGAPRFQGIHLDAHGLEVVLAIELLDDGLPDERRHAYAGLRHGRKQGLVVALFEAGFDTLHWISSKWLNPQLEENPKQASRCRKSLM